MDLRGLELLEGGGGAAKLVALPVDVATLPGFEFLLVPGWVEGAGGGGGDDGCDEGHDDEHGEGSRGENLGLKADVLCMLVSVAAVEG